MRNTRGVTLTELMVAVVILTIGVLGMFGAFKYINIAIHVARARTLATNLAQERVESLKNLTYYELLVTTSASTLTAGATTFLYDTANYPPESISIGGITFTRYTLVSMADVESDVISAVSYTYPDTGMKQITVNVVWRDNGATKVWTLNNLLENPFVNPLDSSLSGYAATPTGARLAGTKVEIQQYPDYTATTDSSGNYSFRIYHGTYTVRMSSSGYYDWISPIIQTYQGGSTVLNSSMTAIATGTIAGIAWYNPNLVISQVMASSVQASGFDAEYVELYNPTTGQINIATAGNAALVRFNYGSGNNESCSNVPMVYVSTFVLPNHYFLIANTPSFALGNVTYSADAYYDGGFNHGNCSPWNGGTWSALSGYDVIQSGHSGLVWLSDTGGNTIDAAGWTNGGATPNNCSGHCSQSCNGTCMPLTNGLEPGEQAVRVSSPAASLDVSATSAYGRAYNSGNNAADFFYPADNQSYRIQFPPKNSASSAVPITGVPAIGAYVGANDTNSGSANAASVSISSAGQSLPYARFSLPGVSTGTWTVEAALNGYYQEFSNVAVVQNQTTAVPNAATSPAWTGAGLAHVRMSSSTLNGFVKGQISDINGTNLSGITVQAGGGTKTTGSNGMYFMSVSSGPTVIVVNPSNANPGYIQDVLSVDVTQGQITTRDDTLTQGVTLQGYMTTGTTPVPNFTVSATKGGNQMGTAVTNASGIFTIRNLSTGTYDVTPVLDVGQDSNPNGITGVSAPSGIVFVGTFTVTGAFGTISGNIRLNGAPVTTGALIMASTTTIGATPPAIAGSSSAALSPYYSASSKADGTYSLPVRGSTSYSISVYVPAISGNTVSTSYKTYTGVTVAPGGSTSLDLSLP